MSPVEPVFHIHLVRFAELVHPVSRMLLICTSLQSGQVSGSTATTLLALDSLKQLQRVGV